MAAFKCKNKWKNECMCARECRVCVYVRVNVCMNVHINVPVSGLGACNAQLMREYSQTNVRKCV